MTASFWILNRRCVCGFISSCLCCQCLLNIHERRRSNKTLRVTRCWLMLHGVWCWLRWCCSNLSLWRVLCFVLFSVFVLSVNSHLGTSVEASFINILFYIFIFSFFLWASSILISAVSTEFSEVHFFNYDITMLAEIASTSIRSLKRSGIVFWEWFLIFWFTGFRLGKFSLTFPVHLICLQKYLLGTLLIADFVLLQTIAYHTAVLLFLP